MQLRPYQREAVDAVYNHLRTRDDNPCVVIPTGGGKTPLLATICRDAVERWSGRVVILAHVKELLEQAADKLRVIAPGLPVGIYSAGLGRKDLGYDVTIAGIQSIYQKACSVGPVDLVIADECHLIPPDGEGMYQQFLKDMKVVNPRVRVIGLTATPFRMKSGNVCGPDTILNHICYEVGVRELIEQGFLCQLRSKAGVAKGDTSRVKIRGGEFVAGELETVMDDDGLVMAACAEIVEHTMDRHSVLIFCAGVQHGEHVVRTFRERHELECGFIEGNTPPLERESTLARFKAGKLKYLANVNVLTTGFDAPNVDCVAMLRPTLSPGLYYQMVGRGFRLCEGKADCLVLDFGGNVVRHGPVDAINIREPSRSTGEGDAPAKECPECNTIVPAGCAKCYECGHEFPPPEREKHEATASAAGPLSGQKTRETVEVYDVGFHVHHKRGAAPGEAPPTMRVEYEIDADEYMREWICFEHQRFARRKAEAWWRRRSNTPVPQTVAEAVELARAGALAPVNAITVEWTSGVRWPQVVDSDLGEPPPASEFAGMSSEKKPEPAAVSSGSDWESLDIDDIPF
ncbi:MAG: DNA helicase [Phycisphaeraceae bacterium]|nr:MAG: DNA helicase [Phycisphaeraceae bacterium]